MRLAFQLVWLVALLGCCAATAQAQMFGAQLSRLHVSGRRVVETDLPQHLVGAGEGRRAAQVGRLVAERFERLLQQEGEGANARPFGEDEVVAVDDDALRIHV